MLSHEGFTRSLLVAITASRGSVVPVDRVRKSTRRVTKSRTGKVDPCCRVVAWRIKGVVTSYDQYVLRPSGAQGYCAGIDQGNGSSNAQLPRVFQSTETKPWLLVGVGVSVRIRVEDKYFLGLFTPTDSDLVQRLCYLTIYVPCLLYTSPSPRD